ncbi:MAG: T9SS type A sorting domain-containing protein [Chitinophagaceae bacterium]|nr:T9SS type A sorting domain-containing protein [Chitinophagaceae bacterium]
MKNVTVSYNITGTCTPITSWLTVSSNEPLTGTGCGDIAPDWIIVNNHHLKLRAERAGHGNGRIYTICINAKDAAGNITTQKAKVTVPHNQGCSNSKGAYNNEGYIDANGDYFDQWFECSLTPNPSGGSFNLQVATASNDKIEVTILDVSGRLIHKLNTVKNQSLRFGDELKNGVYMVIITQGQQQQIIKLIKQ